jgi:tetratricopeptide (TPR) repeat protein
MPHDRDHDDPIEQVGRLHEEAEQLAQGDHYREAILVATQARRSARINLGPNHPVYAASLNNLAALYHSIGDHGSALPICRQALRIRREALGKSHPDYVTSLNNLAALYEDMGNYAAALPLYSQAVKIRRATLGKKHPDYATSLDNLAGLHQEMGNHSAALRLYQRALGIYRAAFGQGHPDYAVSLSNLAGLHQAMGEYAVALPLYRQALEIRRLTLGETHPLYAASLNNLAELHEFMGDHVTAEALRRQALEITGNVTSDDQGHAESGSQNEAQLHEEVEEQSAAVRPRRPGAGIEAIAGDLHLLDYSPSLEFSTCRPTDAKSGGLATGIRCVRAPDRAPRLFPPIGEKLFAADESEAGLTPGEVVARRLLALAGRPLNRRQRVLGWGLDLPGRLGRALWMFREGLRSESAGRWGLADFYWHQSRDALRSLLDTPGAWIQIVRSAGGAEGDGGELPDAERWARTLANEVFIDTHCGFYNGSVPRPGVQALDHRAFDHAAAIENCLTLGPTPPDPGDRYSLLAPPWELQLELALGTQNWDRARAAVLRLRRLFPDRLEYLDKMVEIEFMRTTKSLANCKHYPLVELTDAETIKEGIKRLNAFRRDFPHVLSAFDALGKLYHIRALKLARVNVVSEALVEAQRALAHAPDLVGIGTTIEKISERLQAVIEVGARIRDDVARYDVQLTSEGQRLCIESSKGFRPFNEYIESRESDETAKALAVARNRDLWSRIGLPFPLDGFEERAQALAGAVTKVLEEQPADAAEAQGAWSSIVVSDESLSSIDPEPINRFLSAHFAAGNNSDSKHDRPGDSAKGIDEPIGELIALPSPPNGRRKAEEPFDFWLFSRRGLLLKVEAIAGLVLLAVGIGLTVQKIESYHARDEAYGRIVRAEEKRDYLEIIQGSEAFLAHRALRGRDVREARVLKLYDEAIVRWFVGRGASTDAQTLEHVQRYRRLAAGARS